MKIEPESAVVLVLQNPREKILGILNEITASGVFVRGINLDYFDEWVNAIKNDEPYLSMQDNFYPMWRLERMSRDEESSGVPSMSAQFEQKIGRPITEF